MWVCCCHKTDIYTFAKGQIGECEPTIDVSGIKNSQRLNVSPSVSLQVNRKS